VGNSPPFFVRSDMFVEDYVCVEMLNDCIFYRNEFGGKYISDDGFTPLKSIALTKGFKYKLHPGMSGLLTYDNFYIPLFRIAGKYKFV
jgi:hypothetical protein